jgi:hypothetical protein
MAKINSKVSINCCFIGSVYHLFLVDLQLQFGFDDLQMEANPE